MNDIIRFLNWRWRAHFKPVALPPNRLAGAYINDDGEGI